MKKFIAAYFIIVTILGYMYVSVDVKDAGAVSSAIVIPEEAIRLRILANSDNEKDQAIKRMVRDEVNKSLAKWTESLGSVEEARAEMKKRLPEIDELVERTLKEKGIDITHSIQFKKVEFPTKLYGNFLYPAGKYEAILITLGEGEGDNWWCVLFPQICLVDESSNKLVAPSSDKKYFEKEVRVEAREEDLEEPIVERVKLETEELVEKETEVTQEPERIEPIIVDEEKTEEIEVRFFLLDLFFGR